VHRGRTNPSHAHATNLRPLASDLAQFVVDKRQELRVGVWIALVHGGLMQANTQRGPLRTRDVRRFRRKVQGRRKAPGMKSPLILVEDRCKGKQAITANVLAFPTDFAENDHVDYRDSHDYRAKPVQVHDTSDYHIRSKSHV
jgi:hypothetical protein